MMEMPIRKSRMLRNAEVLMRGRKVLTKNTVQENVLHRQRMTCAESVRSVTQTQDWTEGVRMSPSGRFQVIEEAKPRRRIISREGIRWDAAWIALALAALLCAAVLIADVAGVGIESRVIRKLNNQIADNTESNDQLRVSLEAMQTDVSVCMEAVKLDLISGYAAPTVRLSVPETVGSGTGSIASGRLTGSAGD